MIKCKKNPKVSTFFGCHICWATIKRVQSDENIHENCVVSNIEVVENPKKSENA